MSKPPVKVSNLVAYIKSRLTQDALIQNIEVQGEISNFTNHRSGHWYFSIKDDKARISCVMFRSYASSVGFAPKDGDKVIVRASVTVFEASGQMQLNVTSMKPDGQGDLYMQFEALKKKLLEEGLFDQAHKKKVPAIPHRIGLITGKATAAREDILSTISRRWPYVEIIEYPTLVQGDGAAANMMGALMTLDAMNLDVIIMARGGGSIEDLWAFNNEQLARVIYACNTPIVTGIGHEIDVTIADYVADLRGPTPTGIAEMITPDQNEVRQYLTNCRNTLINRMEQRTSQYRVDLERLKESRALSDPRSLIENRSLLLDHYATRLNRVNDIVNTHSRQLEFTKRQFTQLAEKKISLLQSELNTSKQLMQSGFTNAYAMKKQALGNYIHLLNAYSPLAVMERGYNLVYSEGKVITSVDDVEIDTTVSIRFKDGEADARLIDKRKYHG